MNTPLDNLNKFKVLLASNSPRRRELLSELGVNYEVRVVKDIDESYPDTLPAAEVAEYISRKKAEGHRVLLQEGNELIITADTVVVLGDRVMGKPHSEAEAEQMLADLSGHTHQVITGVTLLTASGIKSFSVETDVDFVELSRDEIRHYVTHYHPLDKAGAYGIQEWIGFVGVSAIRGSYYNVMGLPIQRLYSELKKL